MCLLTHYQSAKAAAARVNIDCIFDKKRCRFAVSTSVCIRKVYLRKCKFDFVLFE